jgi:hypothetical protein
MRKQKPLISSTYKAPKGWVKSTKEGVVTYLTSDETYGTYCAINIYTSIPTVGNAGEEFTDSLERVSCNSHLIYKQLIRKQK